MAFLAPFAGAMAAVGAVTSAVGAYQQGQAQANAADYNAQVDSINKGLALQDQSRQSYLAQGRAIAGYGASGVQTSSGSPVDVLADSVAQSVLDRAKISYNYDSRINLDRAQADNYRTSSLLNAAGAGLRGIGTAIPMWGSPAAPTSLGSNSGVSVSDTPQLGNPYYG